MEAAPRSGSVDAITAALQLSFDAAPNQVNGALFDVLTGASFDLKTRNTAGNLQHTFHRCLPLESIRWQFWEMAMPFQEKHHL